MRKVSTGPQVFPPACLEPDRAGRVKTPHVPRPHRFAFLRAPARRRRGGFRGLPRAGVDPVRRTIPTTVPRGANPIPTRRPRTFANWWRRRARTRSGETGPWLDAFGCLGREGEAAIGTAFSGNIGGPVRFVCVRNAGKAADARLETFRLKLAPGADVGSGFTDGDPDTAAPVGAGLVPEIPTGTAKAVLFLSPDAVARVRVGTAASTTGAVSPAAVSDGADDLPAIAVPCGREIPSPDRARRGVRAVARRRPAPSLTGFRSTGVASRDKSSLAKASVSLTVV